MEAIKVNDQIIQQLGEEWIQALLDKDYQHLAEICQPDVRSRLMTPRRIDSFEKVADLTQKVESWFHECSSLKKEQTRVTRIGEKLAINYRLGFIKGEGLYTAEQQVYCSLRDGLIDQVSLLCSGFQSLQTPIEMP
jgi:hypothetical protein